MRLTWGEILIASAPVPQPISKRVSERRIYLSSREIDLLLIQVLTKFRLIVKSYSSLAELKAADTSDSYFR